MFNDSMQGISVLSYSLFNSAADIIKANTHEHVTSDQVQFVSKDGDIYFPMNTKLSFNSTNASKKIPNFMIDGESTPMHMRNFSSFSSEYISNDITTIAYNKSVYLPTLLKRLARDPKTYGVIIQDGSNNRHMVNPLHPLVAFSITSGLMELPEEGNLHVFEWSTSSLRITEQTSDRKKKKEAKFYESEYTKVFGMFQYLIRKPVKEKRTASISDDELRRLIESPLAEDINTRIDIRIDTNSGDDINTKTIIVPTQLAISNMATPYYGLMYLNNPKMSNIKGYNMSPMLSGNLNQNLGSVGTFSDTIGNTGSGNVCTGSENSTGHRGWSTLSKVNINSMFNEDLVSTNGVIPFVETSKKIAGTIWEGIEADGLAELDAATKTDQEQLRTVAVED